MQRSPDPDLQLARILHDHFHLTLLGLTRLPHAHAGATWLGRADTSTGPFFLKRTPSPSTAGPAIAHHLHTLGCPALAPMPSRTGSLATPLGADTLMVFPYVAAPTLDPATLEDTGWQALGRTLRCLHDAPIPPLLRQPLETEGFHPWGEDRLASIATLAQTPDRTRPPAQQQLLSLWQQSGHLPADFFAFAHDKGLQARASTPSFGLVHGDFQRDNILCLPSNTFLVIDWDYPSWGPAERDLMFIPNAHSAAFRSGYGRFPNHPVVLEYVEADYLLQELLDCAERVLFRPETGTAEQQWALDLASVRLQQMRDLLPTLSQAHGIDGSPRP